MKKVLFTLFLVFSFLISSISVSAKTSSIDDVLKAKGIPSEVIETMPVSMKKDIARKNLVFNSWEKAESPIRLSSTSDIPDDEFDFYINVYDAPNSSDGKKRRAVYVYYDWTEIPVFWQSDPFGVSWDTDWKPVAGTHFHVDEVRINAGVLGTLTKTLEDNSLEESANSGVGWIAPLSKLKEYHASNTKSLGGYGTITIEEKEAGKAVSNNIYGKYGHVVNPLITPDIKIPGININISGAKYIRAVIEEFDL